MYVSRAVASMRAEPVPGASVALVLETAPEADVDAVADAAVAAGATVERRLPFEDLLVSVAQERVDALCDLDGLVAVQTAAAIETHADEAEEDVDLTELE